jgi:VWFA-related protein
LSRILIVSVLLACTSQAVAQPQALVKLNVVATDAKGAPVTDLRAADIQVREDGKAQPVVFFRFAGSQGAPVQPAPDEFINRPSPPPRLILLDRWNEREMTLASAWQDVGAAVGRMEAVDRLYIYFLANHGELVPVRSLPGVETDLRAAPQPDSKELVAKLDDSVRKLSGFRDVANLDPVFRADATMQALGIVSRLAGLPGSKYLIWVTHGFPLQFLNLTEQWQDYTGPLLALSQTAAQGQVAIYTVDESAQGAGADVAGLSKQTLELLSAHTGGRWYSSGRTSDALAGAATDARGSYQIAYFAPAHDGAPKEHKIRVESPRKGLRLLTRASYLGDAAAPPPDELADYAFTNQEHSPFDATEIGLRVAMSRKPAAIHMEIHVEPGDLLLEHRGDRSHGSVAMKFALYSSGEFQDAQATIQQDIDLTQEQYDGARKTGIVIPRDLVVSGEIQQVRVMVFDLEGHGLGSVTIPIK